MLLVQELAHVAETGLPLSEAKAKADGIWSWATPFEEVCVLLEVEDDLVLEVAVDVVLLEETLEVMPLLEDAVVIMALEDELEVMPLLEDAVVIMALEDELEVMPLLEDAVDTMGEVVMMEFDVMLPVVEELVIPVSVIVF